MGRFCKSLLMLTMLFSSMAFAQMNSQTVQNHKNNQWGLKITTPSTTTLKFVTRSGAAVTGNANLEVGGKTYSISGARLYTLPVDFQVAWGVQYTGAAPLYVYAGATAAGTVSICTSDRPNLIAKGAVAVGNTGYVHCTATLAATDKVRLMGTATANATAHTISAYAEINEPVVNLPVKFYGSQSSATLATTLVFLVPGLAAADTCVVTPVSLGTNVTYFKYVTEAAGAINVESAVAQAGSSTVINYICW